MRSCNTAAHDLCTVITDSGWLQEALFISIQAELTLTARKSPAVTGMLMHSALTLPIEYSMPDEVVVVVELLQ